MSSRLGADRTRDWQTRVGPAVGVGRYEWDLIVVGSGAAGLSTAYSASHAGARVLVLEQAPVVGGTTAVSGGMVWLPATYKSSDTRAAAAAYLRATVPDFDSDVRLHTFIEHADAALRALESHHVFRLRPVPTYPDYEPDLPGATLRGRVLEPEPYDARQLGDAFKFIRSPLPEFMLWGGMMISRADVVHLRRVFRSARSTWRTGGLLFRYLSQRWGGAHRGTTLYLGNALIARLMHAALQSGASIRTSSVVNRLSVTEGRVTGVYVSSSADSSAEVELHACRGVVLATGGLSHDSELRASYLPTGAGSLSATVPVPSGKTGVRLAMHAGAMAPAATKNGAFWVPASCFNRADGTQGVFPHTVTDRAKPGLIAIGSDGRRFCNEAVSYHAFVRAQLAKRPVAHPAWLLCDRRFLWRYGLGKIRPFTVSLGRDLKSGYLRRGKTLALLAESIGVDAQVLTRTVERYNHDARRGCDGEFGRGSDAYQRYMGDPECSPNPNVAPLEQPPFYAVAVYPADLGMAAGLHTDSDSRVLDPTGLPINGLYACGNDMQSVMHGAYPGPGITLGPALVFGWRAACHATGM